MAHINLLPWREELRKQRQQEFGVMAALGAVFALAVVGLAHVQMEGRIDAQQGRNGFLQSQIKVLDKKIAEIKDLEKTKTGLLARMNIIQELQSSRPESVHLMDQLVHTLPDGVHVTSIKQQEGALTLSGIAQSNARVSAYMRNIEASSWMARPKLDLIQTQQEDQRRVAKFTLRAVQKQAKTSAEEGADK